MKRKNEKNEEGEMNNKEDRERRVEVEGKARACKKVCARSVFTVLRECARCQRRTGGQEVRGRP